ncbi:YecA family protein [Miltoncostaea oceani]|uniref:YecA family protein n=1 Tax=Miltoncostaea oceani TaxID=2843216 RepID=UPI001FE8CC6E|nr:SEC-C metal-binding domain-containing protein [Miltoncostaea oceani]
MPIAPTIQQTFLEFIIRAEPQGRPPMAGVMLAPPQSVGLRVLDEVVSGQLPDAMARHIAGVPARFELYLAPDESALEVLCVSGLVDQPGSSSSATWSLVSPPGTSEDLRRHLISGEPVPDSWRRQINVDSEDDLQTQWGRVLSVRDRLRLLLSELSGEEGLAFRSAWASPGQLIVAASLGGPAISESVAAMLAGAEPSASFVDALAAQMPSPEVLGPMPIRASALSYEGPEGWEDWAGPFADGIRDGDYFICHLIDSRRLADLLEQAIARFGLERTDAGEPFPSAEPSVGPEDLLGYQHWLLGAPGVPFTVSLGEFVDEAAGRGMTIAEAVSLVVGRGATHAALTREISDAFSAETGHPATAVSPEALVLGGSERQLVANVASLLRRLSPEEVVAHLVRSHRESLTGPGLGAFGLEGRWFMTHLRRREWRESELPILDCARVEPVADSTGAEGVFELIGALEDEHSVGWLSETMLERIRNIQPGYDLDAALEDGLERMTFSGRSIGFGGTDRPLSAVIHSSNIPSALAHPSLRRGLVLRLRHDYALRPPLLVIAYSSEVMIVSANLDPDRSLVDRGLDLLRAEGMRDQGSRLGALWLIEDEAGEPQGAFDLLPMNPIVVGRNDACPCGSGLKSKRCCRP